MLWCLKKAKVQLQQQRLQLRWRVRDLVEETPQLGSGSNHGDNLMM